LAKRGAKVVVNDLGGARDGSEEGSNSAADLVVEEIKALGGEAVANYDSVSTVEGGEAIVKKAIDAFGQVDILINNAGILRDKSFGKMLPEDWEQVLSVHLTGAYNVTRPAFMKMRERGYGRIVMTTGIDEHAEAGGGEVQRQGEHGFAHRGHQADGGYFASGSV
jgi:NAD(P)-dependent dehydrogenase (short-subunit alcohol dehydrogenase family)